MFYDVDKVFTKFSLERNIQPKITQQKLKKFLKTSKKFANKLNLIQKIFKVYSFTKQFYIWKIYIKLKSLENLHIFLKIIRIKNVVVKIEKLFKKLV